MNRNPLPDLLKGIAVLLMIQVHIMELFMLPDVYESAFGRVSLFLGGVPAAPVFMVVMGYFAAYSAKSNKQHFLRGLRLILLGLILNIGLNAHLLILFFREGIDIDPLAYIFGADILFLAGLSLIFLAIIRHFVGKNLWVFLVLTFIIPFLAEFTPFLDGSEGWEKYILAFFMSHAGWSYFPFFPWAGWVMAGFSFAVFEQKFAHSPLYIKYGSYPVILAGIPVIVFLPWAFQISVYLPLYYHHGLIFFIWGLFFCMLWIFALRFIVEKAGNSKILQYLKWLGRHVTMAYVIQWLVIGNIATALYRTLPVYMFWIFLAVVIVVTSALVYIIPKKTRI